MSPKTLPTSACQYKVATVPGYSRGSRGYCRLTEKGTVTGRYKAFVAVAVFSALDHGGPTPGAPSCPVPRSHLAASSLRKR
eukprot:1867480-Rhodomonas_salina.2